MHENPFNKREVFLALVVAVIFSIISFYWFAKYNRSLVVFCDVGQGDAAYIRLKEGLDILVDAGPNKKVLDCLGKYMPFYDRSLEILFISHTQKDHYGGVAWLQDRYSIKNLFLSPSGFLPPRLSKIIHLLKEKGATIRYVFSGDRIVLGTSILTFLWPEAEHTKASKYNRDPNNGSQIFLFKNNSIKILFTGDATPLVLDSLLNQDLLKVDVLKVPHHGSTNGLTEKFLNLADPKTTVISVGKNNSYGHPSRNVLEMIRKNGASILRTDEIGDIQFNLR